MNKRTITYLILTITAATIFSCRKKREDQPQLTTYVKSITDSDRRYDFEYDSQNRPYRQISTANSGSVTTSTITQYNAQNKPTELITRNTFNSSVQKSVFVYDAGGRISTNTISDSINPTTYTINEIKTFTYTGSIVLVTTTSAGGTVSVREEFTMDANGNRSKVVRIDRNGVRFGQTDFTAYDNKPYVFAIFNHFGQYAADPKNNPLASRYTDLIRGTTRDNSNTYEYNADGYVTRVSDGTGDVVTIVYEKR
jgi:hypothetical protein